VWMTTSTDSGILNGRAGVAVTMTDGELIAQC
jgi:hypothetical protein